MANSIAVFPQLSVSWNKRGSQAKIIAANLPSSAMTAACKGENPWESFM